MQGASPSENAQATEYGNYLSARFAASQHDLKEAADYYRASAKANPTNPQLLGRALYRATTSGDVEAARLLAQRLVALTPDGRAGRLPLAVVELKHREYERAPKLLAQSAQRP